MRFLAMGLAWKKCAENFRLLLRARRTVSPLHSTSRPAAAGERASGRRRQTASWGALAFLDTP